MPTQISGTTGVSQIQDGVITNADVNSGAAIDGSKLALNSVTGSQLVNNTVTFDKITQNSGNFSFRNKIINPAMEFDQRNVGTAITCPINQLRYVADRWYTFTEGSSITCQQVTTTTPGVNYLARITGAAGNTRADIGQRILGANMTRTQNTFSLSFWAASNSKPSVKVLLNYNGNTSTDVWTNVTSYPAESFFVNQFVSITNTLTRYTINNITVPSLVFRGAQITFQVTNLLAGQTLDITGVQLEEGPVATPLEIRPKEVEKALCQAYYEKTYLDNVIPAQNSVGNFVNGRIVRQPNIVSLNAGIVTTNFLVPKIKPPSVTIYPGNTITVTPNRYSNYGEANAPERAATPIEITQNGFYVRSDHNGTLTNVAMVYHYVADAEL